MLWLFRVSTKKKKKKESKQALEKTGLYITVTNFLEQYVLLTEFISCFTAV